MDSLIFGQKFGKMFKVGIIVLRAIQIYDNGSCFVRDGTDRFASSVTMNKEFLSLFFVSLQHSVDMPNCTTQS